MRKNPSEKRKALREKHRQREEEEVIPKSAELVNKLIHTIKKPTKESLKIVKFLRNILKPNSLANLKDTYFKAEDIGKFSNAFFLSHTIFLNKDNTLVIYDRITKKDYKLKIVEFFDNFKNFSNELYRTAPLLSFGGFEKEKDLKRLFSSMHKEPTKEVKRVLSFTIVEGEIFIRHFCWNVHDDTANYMVGLKEIGPRITLKKIE